MNRAALSTDQPYLVVDEREPDGQGGEVDTTTIFLTASQCPVGCSMCDLYRNTLASPTPLGSIPQQMDVALASRSHAGWIKLYNSGNFFDPRSIPPGDYPSIAARCNEQRFSRVVVENHPKFGRDRLRRFVDLIDAPLEVAVGLETVQPRWLDRMRKQMSRDDFDCYARWLKSVGVDLRVFLIIGVPGVDVTEAIRWARLSTRHAVACGARHVSLIPARSGHGWNGLADELPELSIDALIDLQRAVVDDANGQAAVTIDLWDVQPGARRIDELRRVNLSQRADPR
jgi:radical SAM enzyme (TIGR01210 family)